MINWRHSNKIVDERTSSNLFYSVIHSAHYQTIIMVFASLIMFHPCTFKEDFLIMQCTCNGYNKTTRNAEHNRVTWPMSCELNLSTMTSRCWNTEPARHGHTNKAK